MEEAKKENLIYAVYDTAAGDITIVANRKAVVSILYGSLDPEGCTNDENIPLYDAITEINRYFFGQLKDFTVPLELKLPESEKKIFRYVQNIPYGEMRTYEEACKKLRIKEDELEIALLHNPIPIIIPCHRVVRNEEELGSYIGGEELKKKILHLEKSNAARFILLGM